MDECDGDQERRLRAGIEIYCRRVEKVRHDINIIGPNESIEEHCADCLAAARFFEHEYTRAAKTIRQTGAGKSIVRFADVGTGAGLPGIPLALWFYSRATTTANDMISYEWLLMERTHKKARVLEETIKTIENTIGESMRVKVVCADIHHWKPADDIVDSIYVITARAFSPVTRRVLKSFRGAAPHAVALLYKGTRAAIDTELANIGVPSARLIEALHHPAGKERHLVIIDLHETV